MAPYKVVKAPFSERLVEYALAVTGWSYFYSYIAEPLTRLEVGEFIHLETLELEGTLTSPKSRLGLSAKILVACEKAPRDGETSRYDRPVLGNLAIREKVLEGYVLLPAGHVTRLTAVASSNRLEGVRLMATSLYRRKALVRSINVFTGGVWRG
jgi:hypothetical protein